ncbi:hypothetical protein D3C79_720830 [compost metagenome]
MPQSPEAHSSSSCLPYVHTGNSIAHCYRRFASHSRRALEKKASRQPGCWDRPAPPGPNHPPGCANAGQHGQTPAYLDTPAPQWPNHCETVSGPEGHLRCGPRCAGQRAGRATLPSSRFPSAAEANRHYHRPPGQCGRSLPCSLFPRNRTSFWAHRQTMESCRNGLLSRSAYATKRYPPLRPRHTPPVAA